MNIEDGNIARLERSHTLLCPFCGSIAARVGGPSLSFGPTQGAGDTPDRKSRRTRLQLRTEIEMYLADNPQASKREVQHYVGGKAQRVSEIVDQLREVKSYG